MVKKSNIRKLFAVSASLACAATFAAGFSACGTPDENGGEAALTSGTYWAELEKAAMGSTLNYTVHITLDAEKNTYYFSSYYVYEQATYVVSESGTYTDNGTKAVFSTAGKDALTATISEGAFTLDKDVAGKGISTAELTYEKGAAPVYVTYNVDGEEYEKVGYKNATDEVVAVAASAEKAGFTFSWGSVPATAGTGATVNGAYTADNVADDDNDDNDEDEAKILTYWAEHQKSAMGSTLTYTVHITLDEGNKTYYFSNYYVMDNEHAHATFVNSESGTYTDDGVNIVFSTDGKDDLTATISDDGFVLERDVAGMGATVELTYVLGEAPVYVVYYVDGEEYSKVGYKNATDEVVAISEADEIDGYTFSWIGLPETAGAGANVYGNYTSDGSEGEQLVSGDYNVDVTWSAMYQYNKALEYHVVIGDDSKFEILNQAQENKGSGTVSYEDGVYTLNYENGKETTFIFNSESGKIIFTSKLWINTIAFNRVGDDGVTFVPYIAVITEE